MTELQEIKYSFYEKLYGKPDKVFSQDEFLQMVWVGIKDTRRILIDSLGFIQKSPFENEPDSFKNKGLCYYFPVKQENGIGLV